MNRRRRALVPAWLPRWLTEPAVEERVQARTAGFAAFVNLYRRLIAAVLARLDDRDVLGPPATGAGTRRPARDLGASGGLS